MEVQELQPQVRQKKEPYTSGLFIESLFCCYCDDIYG